MTDFSCTVIVKDIKGRHAFKQDSFTTTPEKAVEILQAKYCGRGRKSLTAALDHELSVLYDRANKKL